MTNTSEKLSKTQAAQSLAIGVDPIRARAFDIWKISDPDKKCRATEELAQVSLDKLVCSGSDDFDWSIQIEAENVQKFVNVDSKSDSSQPLNQDIAPGRPPQPILVHPSQVEKRSPFTNLGRVTLVHALCHIEFNAINLALDAVWRFDKMPEKFYFDWLTVAREESKHFLLLSAQLKKMGSFYGACSAHDGLWEMCRKTRSDIVARMALVPRTLEARGLDAVPVIQQRLSLVSFEVEQTFQRAQQKRSRQGFSEEDALGKRQKDEIVLEVDSINSILSTILHDEVGHVAIGNYWYHYLCNEQKLEPLTQYRKLVDQYQAPKNFPPLNFEARKKAGFTEDELNYLMNA